MQFNKEILIGKIKISISSKTFIIAEAGVNHGGDISVAKKLINLAVEAGADAVKFQTFKAEQLVLKNVPKALYQQKTTDAEESQFEMLKKLEVTKEQNLELKRYCFEKGVMFLTTPFGESSLNELDDLDLVAYKVASTDITNLPFLKKVAMKKKPIFLSTGMSYLSEIEIALKEIYPINKDVILLQCCANYPIKDEEANLNVINTYKKRFDIMVGYSDHSSGIGAAPYAVAMGAKVIEKHFTLDKAFKGPDHRASLSPAELVLFVNEIRKVEKYLGSGIKLPTISELETRRALLKHLVTTKAIRKGEKFTIDNVGSKRTGGMGVSPIYYKNIIGWEADKDYKADEIILG